MGGRGASSESSKMRKQNVKDMEQWTEQEAIDELYRNYWAQDVYINTNRTIRQQVALLRQQDDPSGENALKIKKYQAQQKKNDIMLNNLVDEMASVQKLMKKKKYDLEHDLKSGDTRRKEYDKFFEKLRTTKLEDKLKILKMI